MLETLLALCTKAVAGYIVDDVYTDKEFQLKEALSNLVFEEIHSQRRKKTPAALKVVSENLSVTHAKWKGQLYEVDDSEFELFYGQKGLKTLIIDPEQVPNKLIDTLKKLLCAESCVSLTMLDVSRYCRYYISGYETVGQFLPSLQFIKLTRSSHRPEECVAIFENFTSLRELDLTGSTILRFTNTQNLQYLVSLIICDIRFQKTRNLIGIFELKQLQVLDISGNDRDNLKNLELFLDCMKTLPSLTTIDCSKNKIRDVALLDKLIESHPTLSEIFLIGTSASEYKNGKVIIHQDFSIVSSIDCLDHATAMFRRSVATELMEKIKKWISDDHDDQDKTTLRNLVVSIINTLDTIPMRACKRLHKLGGDCLVMLCKENRVQNFDDALQRDLVDKLSNTFNYFIFPFDDENDSDIVGIQENYFSILNSNYLLNNSDLPLEKARFIAVKLFKSEKINEALGLTFLKVLIKVWKKGYAGSTFRRDEEMKMKTELFHSFSLFNFSEETEEYKYLLILKAMEEVFKYSENTENLEFETAELLTNTHLPLFKKNPFVQSKIFRILEILLEKIHMDSMHVFLDQSTFKFLVQMILKTRDITPILNYVVRLFYFDLKSKNRDSCIQDKDLMVFQIMDERMQSRPIKEQQSNNYEPQSKNSEAMKHWRVWVTGWCIHCNLALPLTIINPLKAVRF